MEKYELFHIKTGNVFFAKETFLVYPTLTDFTQRKRNKYDANDLLALSLVSMIVYILSWKKSYDTYLKTTVKKTDGTKGAGGPMAIHFFAQQKEKMEVKEKKKSASHYRASRI